MSAPALPALRITLPRVILLLIAMDALMIAIYVAMSLPSPLQAHAWPRLMLDVDRSLPEVLLYGKWLAVLFLMVRAANRGGGAICLSLAMTFLIIASDDSFSLHEDGGLLLSRSLHFPSILGLRPTDLGELMIWAMLGAIVVVSLAVGWLKSSRLQRRMAMPMLLIFAALIGAGIGVDMLHVAITENMPQGLAQTLVNIVLTLMEDGSELVLGTLAVWQAMRLAGIGPAAR
jgi:hypothetical protein